MRKVVLVICLVLMILPIFANEAVPINDILLADVPIYYGEENFTDRILERTKGERDPIGLVLTGGSARAFAHIGVLKYLEEQNIEPDFIISNSMGSIIAMLYSAGVSPDQILEVITNSELSAYFNLTLPLGGGLLDPSGFEGLVTSVVGTDVDIKDLPIPVMVVCEDLVTKREVRICEGPFSKVLLAAFALPVYFPPQEYRGHLLIDGGIKSLNPIDVAYQYSDTVICSTTFYDVDSLNLRNVITILNSAFDINKRYNAAAAMREHIDSMIWIRCAVEQFSFMAFDKAAVMAEIGYESAASQAEALSKLYKNGLSKEVVENRIAYEKSIEEARNGLYFFNHIEQVEPSNTLSLVFKNFEEIDSLFYLKQSFDFGFEYQFKHRKVELGATVGATSYSQVMSQSTISPFLGVHFNYFPISRIKFSLSASAAFNNKQRFYIPSFMVNESFIFKFYSKEELEFAFSQALELEHDFQYGGKTEYIFSMGLNGQIPILSSLVDLKTTYLGVGFLTPNQSYNSYIDIKFDTRLQFKKLGGAYFDFGLLSRIAIDGNKKVPLFFNDGFLTNEKSYYNLKEYCSDDQYLFMLPLSIGYAVQQTPTFAEVIILQALEFWVYCDLLFNDGPTPKVSTGAEFKLNLSLIGLQDFPFTVRIGYDSVTKTPIYSIRFSVV